MNAWTEREVDVLETLTLRVRTLTKKQLAQGWWKEEGEAGVESGIGAMCELGLVEQLEVYAHPLLPIEPVFSWKPGDGNPESSFWEELADRLRARWSDPDVRFTAYVATERARNLFGSYVRGLPMDEQWTHDIHVGQCYVAFKQNKPKAFIERLVGEGAVPKLGKDIFGMKDPDLFVLDEHGQATQVIEFAGSYDAVHLEDLHQHFAGRAHQMLVDRFPDRKHRLYPHPQGTPYYLL